MIILEKCCLIRLLVIVNFETISLEDKFLLLLGSQQIHINLLVINYVNKCFGPESCIISSNGIKLTQTFTFMENRR